MSELRNLWAMVKADLERARSTLPPAAASDSKIRDYQGYIDHNELELACDMLAAYAEDRLVSKGFWLGLRDAATTMKLSDRAAGYERKISNLESIESPNDL